VPQLHVDFKSKELNRIDLAEMGRSMLRPYTRGLIQIDAV